MILNDLEWLSYVKFSLLRTAVSATIDIFIVELFIEYFRCRRHQQRCAEADRDPQNMADPQKNCRSFVDE